MIRATTRDRGSERRKALTLAVIREGAILAGAIPAEVTPGVIRAAIPGALGEVVIRAVVVEGPMEDQDMGGRT
jgi:hypothetical protein